MSTTIVEPRAAYQTAKERSAGVCEGCGTNPATTIHRRARQPHDTPQNLLHLCPSCTTTAGTIVGQQLGWTVRTGNSSNLVPVFNKRTSQWTRDGETINPNDAVEYMVLVSQISSGSGYAY